MQLRRMQRKRGFTLVELMLGMALGLVVMLALLTFFTSNLRASQTSLELARLNQEMQTLATMVGRDIRRAGYRGDARENRDVGSKDFMFIPGNFDNSGNLTLNHLDDLDADNGSHGTGGPYRCIVLMADLNQNALTQPLPEVQVTGVPDEIVGYRWNAGNQTVDVGRWRVTTPTCGNASSWQALTSNDIEISQFDLMLDPALLDGESRLKQSVTFTITANIRRKPEVEMTISQRVRLRNNVY